MMPAYPHVVSCTSTSRLLLGRLKTVGDGMAPCIKTSDKHNAIYATDDFIRCLTRAAVSNGQVAGCTMSARDVPAAPGMPRNPTDEWIRSVAIRSKPGQIQDCLAETVGRQLNQLRDMGMITNGQKTDAAIDMHLIPRYDKKYGSELVRSKKKSGTIVFERYITIQCIVKHCRLVLGALHMPALEDTADFVRKIIDSARRAGAELGVVMLDREFFSAAVISELDAAGVRCIIPCKNTDTVVATLNENGDVKKRRREVKSVISGTTKSARYTMVITKRRKKRSGKTDVEKLPAHERLIGFATNVPGIDPNEYSRRWGIETGYRMIENARVRTHSKSPVVRMLYFVYSAAVFNAWVMANAMMRNFTGIVTEDPLITQQCLNDVIKRGMSDYRMLPQPPPPVPP